MALSNPAPPLPVATAAAVDASRFELISQAKYGNDESVRDLLAAGRDVNEKDWVSTVTVTVTSGTLPTLSCTTITGFGI